MIVNQILNCFLTSKNLKMKYFFFLFVSIVSFCNTNGQTNFKTTCTDSTKNDILESISFYRGRLSIDSTDQISFYKIGMCFYKLHEFNSAINYFNKLLSLNPDYSVAYANRGICNLLLNKKKEACIDFLQSIKKGQDQEVINGQKISEWLKKECNQ